MLSNPKSNPKPNPKLNPKPNPRLKNANISGAVIPKPNNTSKNSEDDSNASIASATSSNSVGHKPKFYIVSSVKIVKHSLTRFSSLITVCISSFINSFIISCLSANTSSYI